MVWFPGGVSLLRLRVPCGGERVPQEALDWLFQPTQAASVSGGQLGVRAASSWAVLFTMSRDRAGRGCHLSLQRLSQKSL